MRRTGVIIAGIAGVLIVWAAGCGSDAIESDFHPPVGDEIGVVNPPPPFITDGSAPKNDGGGSGCDAGCAKGLVCVVDRCLPPQGKCLADGGVPDGGDAGGLVPCQYDTYCDAKTGQCVPFGTGGLNGR